MQNSEMWLSVCVKTCVFSERRLHLRLEYDSYGSVITSDRLIQLSVIAIDKQTINYHKAEKTIVLDEPVIDVKVEIDGKISNSFHYWPDLIKSVCVTLSLQLVGEAFVNQPVTAEMTLLNPLPEPLHNCSFTVLGVGLTDGKPLKMQYVLLFLNVTFYIIHLTCFLVCLCNCISFATYFPSTKIHFTVHCTENNCVCNPVWGFFVFFAG